MPRVVDTSPSRLLYRQHYDFVSITEDSPLFFSPNLPAKTYYVDSLKDDCPYSLNVETIDNFWRQRDGRYYLHVRNTDRLFLRNLKESTWMEQESESGPPEITLTPRPTPRRESLDLLIDRAVSDRQRDTPGLEAAMGFVEGDDYDGPPLYMTPPSDGIDSGGWSFVCRRKRRRKRRDSFDEDCSTCGRSRATSVRWSEFPGEIDETRRRTDDEEDDDDNDDAETIEPSENQWNVLCGLSEVDLDKFQNMAI